MSTKERRLKEEALKAMRFRGHEPSTWKRHNFYSHTVFINTCTRCGREAAVDLNPPPNGIDVSGEAVALGCDEKKEVKTMASRRPRYLLLVRRNTVWDWLVSYGSLEIAKRLAAHLERKGQEVCIRQVQVLDTGDLAKVQRDLGFSKRGSIRKLPGLPTERWDRRQLRH